jgi:hypothetical protein
MRVVLVAIDGTRLAEITVPDEWLPIGAVVHRGRVFVFHGRMIDAVCAYDEARAFWNASTDRGAPPSPRQPL